MTEESKNGSATKSLVSYPAMIAYGKGSGVNGSANPAPNLT